MAKKRKIKKLAVVASYWHGCGQFYKAVAQQILPPGWEMELFAVAHRSPEDARKEKEGRTFDDSLRGRLDAKLYSSIPTVAEIEALGWKYELRPNTIGDWGNTNQWLETHDPEDYDLILATHDDNLVLNDVWFLSVIRGKEFPEWGVCANSLGMPEGWLRGSCEFFKPWVIRKMGGKFDLSMVTLSRDGETTASEDLALLYDWNRTVDPMMAWLDRHEVPRIFLSPAYRVSSFVIEGERGYIANTHGANTAKEDMGLDFLKRNGVI